MMLLRIMTKMYFFTICFNLNFFSFSYWRVFSSSQTMMSSDFQMRLISRDHDFFSFFIVVMAVSPTKTSNAVWMIYSHFNALERPKKTRIVYKNSWWKLCCQQKLTSTCSCNALGFSIWHWAFRKIKFFLIRGRETCLRKFHLFHSFSSVLPFMNF